MVKFHQQPRSTNKKTWIILLASLCFFMACEVNFLGLLVSPDLNKRLREADNFRFLTHDDLNTDFGEEFSFIVVADTHIHNGNTYGFERLKYVIAGDDTIRFVVVLGDITQTGSCSELERFLEIAASFGIPCYPVIGNHDFYHGNWPIWRDLIGSTRYRVNGNGTSLFILDSANGFFGKEQLDWLDRELRTVSGRVFVFTHINIFGNNSGIYRFAQFIDYRERAWLLSILRGRCDFMFMGHVHQTFMVEAGGVNFLAIGHFRRDGVYALVSVTREGVTYRIEQL